MTVCLAAFAEKAKAIVLVSDKAVTYGGSDEDSSGSGAMQYDTGARSSNVLARRCGTRSWRGTQPLRLTWFLAQSRLLTRTQIFRSPQ